MKNSLVSRRFEPLKWIWVIVFGTLLFSSGVTWITKRQQNFVEHFNAVNTLLRHARIDLAKGYLHTSLAILPQTPFDPNEGMQLLDQASRSLTRALELEKSFNENTLIFQNNTTSFQPLKDYTTALTEFHNLINPQHKTGTPDPVLATQLRLLYFTLERHAETVDALIQQLHFQRIQRYSRYYTLTLWFSGLALASICGLIYKSSRARKQVDEKLSASEVRFSKLFQNSPIASAICEFPGGQFVNANQAMLDLFGYSCDKFIGKTSEELGLWPNFQERADFMALINQHGRVKNYDISAQNKQGKRHDLLVSAELIEFNEKSCMFGMLIDITDKKRAEAALQASEQKYRSLFENMMSSIINARAILQNDKLVDIEILSVNPRFVAITGITEPVNGRNFSEVFPGYFEHDHEALSIFRSVIETHEPKRWIHYLPVINRWLACMIYSPIQGELIIFSDDITAQKQIEHEIHQQSTELIKRNQELERFNRITVDRELEMINLKQQINQLSRQLGQEAPYSLDFLTECET